MDDFVIMILNYNTKVLLKDCLQSLLKSVKPQKIWVIDNASTDGSLKMLKTEFSKVNVIYNNENLGFSKGYNVGLKKVNSKIYLLLNSDTKTDGGSTIRWINYLAASPYSIMASKLTYPDGRFQPNAGDLPFGLALITWISGLDDFFNTFGVSLPSFHRLEKKYYLNNPKVGWVSGTIMAIKKEVFNKIGYFDEKIFMYAEDVDLCIRANEAGLKVGIFSDVTFVHLGGGSHNNPQFKQWLGEFKGMIYLYQKYLGTVGVYALKILIYFFVIIRLIIFYLLGKKEFAKNYLNIIKSI
ncbi:glycosyltransferase family 2 protein [Candidatus Daviesbacteria bacterium]|nr:glycosyltransferase family 2 protein [Candidatus Daviesbacteria bacterium]